MRRLFRAIGIERGRQVDQILDSELNRKLKESEKRILPQKEILEKDKEEWLLIKQEFLIRNMLHEEIQFVKDLLLHHRHQALKPLQDAHNIWTDNCSLKPLLNNIKEQLTTYQDQHRRRLQEEKDSFSTFSMDSYNYDMCQLDLQKRTLQTEIELAEKAINCIVNGQEEHLKRDPADTNSMSTNLQLLNRKLKKINHDQTKIEDQIVGLENEIDLFNEGHFIKSGFIQNGSKILEIIEKISDLSLEGRELPSSESELSRRYWFFNCQHQTLERKQECMMKSMQASGQFKPSKYSPSSHAYIGSANYLKEKMGLAFPKKELNKLNQSIKESKSLILLNLKNLMSPGLQVSYEDKQGRIDQLNTQKMDLIQRFNNTFHEIILQTKRQTQIDYNARLLQCLDQCSTQEEKFSHLNAEIQARSAQMASLDGKKIEAYNHFRKHESIRNLNHLILSLQDQVRWRQKAEDIRCHLEKQMKALDRFFEKRTSLCLSGIDRDLAMLFNRNKEMSSAFKNRGLVEFSRLDDQFERQFLRMNFGRVQQGFQELQNIFQQSQSDDPFGAAGANAAQGNQPNAAHNNNNNHNNNEHGDNLDIDDDEIAFLAAMHQDRDGDFEMVDDLEDIIEMRRARFLRPRARRFEPFNPQRMQVDEGLDVDGLLQGDQPARQQQQQQPLPRQQPEPMFNFNLLTVRNNALGARVNQTVQAAPQRVNDQPPRLIGDGAPWNRARDRMINFNFATDITEANNQNQNNNEPTEMEGTQPDNAVRNRNEENVNMAHNGNNPFIFNPPQQNRQDRQNTTRGFTFGS